MADQRGHVWLFNEEWGFEEKPNEADFNSYFKSLLICAMGDGDISKAERDWVLGYLVAFGGPEELVEELTTYLGTDDLATTIAGTPAVSACRIALLYDAVRACSADGLLTPEERDRIKDAARLLGQHDDIVAELESVYGEEKAARDHRHQIAFPSGKVY